MMKHLVAWWRGRFSQIPRAIHHSTVINPNQLLMLSDPGVKERPPFQEFVRKIIRNWFDPGLLITFKLSPAAHLVDGIIANLLQPLTSARIVVCQSYLVYLTRYKWTTNAFESLINLVWVSNAFMGRYGAAAKIFSISVCRYFDD